MKTKNSVAPPKAGAKLLQHALQLVRFWHGRGLGPNTEACAWDMYYYTSPDMGIFREAFKDPTRAPRAGEKPWSVQTQDGESLPALPDKQKEVSK